MFNVVRILAVVLLAAVLGAASLHYDFFPGSFLGAAFKGLDAVRIQARQQSNAYNMGAVFPAGDDSGVILWDDEAAQPGFTLFTMGDGTAVHLIDMEGAPVHTWEVSYLDIWENTGEVTTPVPGEFIYIRKAKLYPDGRLLVIFSAWSTTPYGYGIALLDVDSNVLWKNFQHIHHSFDQAADGDIYALDQRIRVPAPGEFEGVTDAFIDDGIAHYSANGEYLGRFSLADAFVNSRFPHVIPLLAAVNPMMSSGDLLHANDVEVLNADIAAKFPFAAAGDLLVSLRQIDAIAIVDPEQESVKWFRKGYWTRQHDADFLANGNMLIFDNFRMQLSPAGQYASGIIEFDPVTMEIVWEYAPTGEQSFFTAARGSQQRLPNGNTLITEADRARAFEVNPTGKIVWDYRNTVRLGANDEWVPGIFWATRYTPDFPLFLQSTEQH